MFLKLKLFNLMKYRTQRKGEINIGKYEGNLVNSIILSFSSKLSNIHNTFKYVYREILERQAEADSKLALALALGTRSGFRDSDAPAVGFRDSAAPALGFRAALTPGFRDSDSPEIGFRDLDPVGTGYRDSISAGNRDTWAAEGLDDEYTKKRDEMFARNLQEEGLRNRCSNRISFPI